MRASFATRRVDLGPCDCPDRPHAADEAYVKERFTFGDLRRVAWSLNQPELLSQPVIMERALVSWNLVDELGDPVPISVESIDDLGTDQTDKLVTVLNERQYTEQIERQIYGSAQAPNPSGESSGNGLAEPPSSTSTTTTPISETPLS